jgi:hypothetical protein
MLHAANIGLRIHAVIYRVTDNSSIILSKFRHGNGFDHRPANEILTIVSYLQVNHAAAESIKAKYIQRIRL